MGIGFTCILNGRFTGEIRLDQEEHVEFKIAVLGGDGIGPEVTAQGVMVLKALERLYGHRFDLEYGDVGGASMDNHGTPLLPEVRDLAASADAELFGAVGGPKWDDPSASEHPEDALLQLRAHLGVFANIRPVKVYQWLAEIGRASCRERV